MLINMRSSRFPQAASISIAQMMTMAMWVPLAVSTRVAAMATSMVTAARVKKQYYCDDRREESKSQKRVKKGGRDLHSDGQNREREPSALAIC